MNKFCFFTDSQCNSHTVSSRRDNFEEACLAKIKEIVAVGNANSCDIFCGGDFIDSPYLGHSFIVRLIDTLREFKHTFYLTLGNHDILGRNLNTYRNSRKG